MWLHLAMLEKKTSLSSREELANGIVWSCCGCLDDMGSVLGRLGAIAGTFLSALDTWAKQCLQVEGVALGYMRHQAGLELLFMVTIDTSERERT